MTNFMRYSGNRSTNAANTQAGPSPFIWNDSPTRTEIEQGDIPGVYLFSDFADYGLPGTQTSEVSVAPHWKVFAGSGSSVATSHAPLGASAGTMGGHIKITGTNNILAVIGTQACPFAFTGDSSTSGKLWMECRIGLTSIATNNGQLFVGFSENDAYTFQDLKPLGNADACASDGVLLGMEVQEDGLGVVRGVYADKATSWTAAAASVGTFAANTYAKLGMVYDPDDATNCIRFYFNGVPTSSVISRATLTGTTNLKADSVGLNIAWYGDSATGDVYVDWIKCVQKRP